MSRKYYAFETNYPGTKFIDDDGLLQGSVYEFADREQRDAWVEADPRGGEADWTRTPITADEARKNGASRAPDPTVLISDDDPDTTYWLLGTGRILQIRWPEAGELRIIPGEANYTAVLINPALPFAPWNKQFGLRGNGLAEASHAALGTGAEAVIKQITADKARAIIRGYFPDQIAQADRGNEMGIAEQDKAHDAAQDFLDRYGLGIGGNSNIDVRDGSLHMSVAADNESTLIDFELPVEQADSKHIAEAFYEAASNFDPIDEFDTLWSDESGRPTGYTPAESLKMLEEDKTEFMLKATQAMIDNGLDVDLDPRMPVLDVKMSAGDIAQMLHDGQVPITPHNILEATQGFAGRDGTNLAAYAAVQGGNVLKSVVEQGRANEDYGFDMTQANQPEQKQPEHDAPTL